MIAEVQKYRDVICISCCQPISLSAKAAQRDAKFRDEESDDPIVPMFTLRCSECERETSYVHWDVIDFEGVPRGKRVRKSA